MHPIFDLRKTVHLYTDAPVDEAAITRALAAAQLAPCHKYTWPWRFTRVGPEARRTIHAIASELKFPRGVPDRVVDKLVQKFLNPQLLVVSQVRSDDAFRAKEDYAAVSCAIQNLCLSLAADGLGSKWSTGGAVRDPRTYELLGIDPEAEEIVGFVFVGHAAEDAPRPERPPVSEHVRTVP